MNRRDFLNLTASAGVAAGVAAATTGSRSPKTPTARAQKDAAERILDTRRINCGYISNGTRLMVDPNGKKLSGIFYDLTQRIGEIAGLEIDWNLETSFANFIEDLRLGKCDTVATGAWPTAKRAAMVGFSSSTFYSGVGVYVRIEDRRFDGDVRKLNHPSYRVATLDGEMSQSIQQSDFGMASVLSLPNTADVSMLLESVATHKADATFIDKTVANLYMKKNPRVLRNITETKPIRVFENTWPFAYGSERLRGILDTAVREMVFSGYINDVLAKHGEENDYYSVRLPIQ